MGNKDREVITQGKCERHLTVSFSIIWGRISHLTELRNLILSREILN
jgi:hypothetical protein